MTTQHAIVTSKALLFHSVENTSLAFTDEVNHNTGISITVHDIKQAPTGSVIGAGRVMSETDKQEIRDFLNGEDAIKNAWLPENLMMLNSQRMVWYVPAQKRPMHFRTDKGKPLTLNVWYPSLVFCFNGSSLSVAAYAGQGRPSLTQPLYHAPLWNIYSTTRLCAGNSDTTNIISVEAMAVWEEAIFNTLYSHANHNRVLASFDGKSKDDPAYIRFIKQKAKSGDKFKASEMTPLGKSLDEWALQAS